MKKLFLIATLISVGGCLYRMERAAKRSAQIAGTQARQAQALLFQGVIERDDEG